MCEILIKAVDATNPNPDKDRMGCYKRGDIVGIEKDGYEWGREERLPKFYLVKIPGLDVETARKYEQEDRDDLDHKIINRRRKYHIPLDSIPTRIRSELLSNGSVTVNLSQIRNYLINKRTGTAD